MRSQLLIDGARVFAVDGDQPASSCHADLVLQSRASEIWHDRLRYGQGGLAHKKGVRILGADRLHQRPSRRGRRHRKALNGNLGHCRLKEPEAPDDIPGHRESTRILDVNVHLCNTGIRGATSLDGADASEVSLQARSAITATDFSALRSLAACTSGGQRLSS